MMLVLMLVFLFVLNGNGEVALVIDAYAAIFFLDARVKKSSNIVGNQLLLFINPFNIINTS